MRVGDQLVTRFAIARVATGNLATVPFGMLHGQLADVFLLNQPRRGDGICISRGREPVGFAFFFSGVYLLAKALKLKISLCNV